MAIIKKILNSSTCLYAMLSVCAFGLIFIPDKVIEIAIHDSYFIFNRRDFYLLLIVTCLIYWLVAFVLEQRSKKLNLFITYLHVISNFATTIILNFLSFAP